MMWRMRRRRARAHRPRAAPKPGRLSGEGAVEDPGPKSRRGRGKRRKLSAWQRKVKKYGGVMQAVKASRAEKRGRRKARRGGRRRRVGEHL